MKSTEIKRIANARRYWQPSIQHLFQPFELIGPDV
jgi:hypothetical protein